MRIVMLLDNAFTGDPRVKKEVDTLVNAGHEIQLFCLRKEPLPENESFNGLRIFRIISPDIFNIKKSSYFNTIRDEITSIVESADVIHAHDHTMLHLGVMLKKVLKKPVLIYDSHELFYSFPLMDETAYRKPILYVKSKMVRYLQKKREERDIQIADKVITVNHSIAKLLQAHHKLEEIPTVIKNVPHFETVKRDKSYFRKKFNIANDGFIFIFISGYIHPVRHNLEPFLSAIKKRSNVDLIITGSGKGREQLEDFANENAIANVHFHDPVPPDQMVKHLGGADIGLLPFWNKKDLSYWNALPNKIFEYLMAGLPLLVTEQPEYKKVIQDFNVGVAVNPEKEHAIDKAITELISNKIYYKEKASSAANSLNWEKEEGTLIKLYQELEVKQTT